MGYDSGDYRPEALNTGPHAEATPINGMSCWYNPEYSKDTLIVKAKLYNLLMRHKKTALKYKYLTRVKKVTGKNQYKVTDLAMVTFGYKIRHNIPITRIQP